MATRNPSRDMREEYNQQGVQVYVADDGMRAVVVLNESGTKRYRTFNGETAHTDAMRAALDVVAQRVYIRNGW